nr:P13 [Passion fruit green spot virus]
MMIPTLYLNYSICVTRTLRTVMVFSGDWDVPRFMELVWYVRLESIRWIHFRYIIPIGCFRCESCGFCILEHHFEISSISILLFVYLYANNNIIRLGERLYICKYWPVNGV